jgi:hypothetical protein
MHSALQKGPVQSCPVLSRPVPVRLPAKRGPVTRRDAVVSATTRGSSTNATSCFTYYTYIISIVQRRPRGRRNAPSPLPALDSLARTSRCQTQHQRHRRHRQRPHAPLCTGPRRAHRIRTRACCASRRYGVERCVESSCCPGATCLLPTSLHFAMCACACASTRKAES